MVGLLAAAEATAEYAVAAKIALLLLVVHNVLNNILRPRLGRFLGQNEWNSVLQEYDQSRTVALTSALLGAFCLILIGESILELFGEYSSAYPVLVVLAANHVVHTSFGMCGGYLNIAGYAGWTLWMTVSLLLINLALNYFLIPMYGAMGAAVATLISYASVNFVTATAVYYLDGLKLYSTGMAVVATIVVFSVWVHVTGVVGRPGALLGVVTSIILTLYLKQEMVISALGKMHELFRSRKMAE
jgi:O-antigen/teichoic acid export membrane protein